MNKQFVNIIIGLTTMFFLDSCSNLTSNECDWEFITSVGGIKSEDPMQTNDGWYLPLKSDVSGLREITNKPTTLNSALECSQIKYSTNDSAVFVTVYRGLVNEKIDCRCCPINIGELKLAKYKVYYKFDNDFHLIGEFDNSKLSYQY